MFRRKLQKTLSNLMKHSTILIILIQITFVGFAQKKTKAFSDSAQQNYTIINSEKDSVKFRDKASQTLRDLRNGAVIVRLKTNDKSVAAYRKAGRNDIADKIVESRKSQNEKLVYAFEHEFRFCKVYFIYANQTTSILDGNYKVFLNKDLKVDSSIVFSDTTFVFCEFGSVEGFSDFSDYENKTVADRGVNHLYENGDAKKVPGNIPAQTSTSPSSYSGLIFLDKNLKQFYRPFPYVQGVYLDNFVPSVRSLNNEMEHAYYRLVSRRDFNERYKKELKKQREQLKQLK